MFHQRWLLVANYAPCGIAHSALETWLDGEGFYGMAYPIKQEYIISVIVITPVYPVLLCTSMHRQV